eukprot:scaffold152083_cov37-Attheya_sp.AAC.1
MTLKLVIEPVQKEKRQTIRQERVNPVVNLEESDVEEQKYVHDDLDKVPPVCPCDTPDSSVVGSLRTTPESPHKVFGCR